MKSKICSEFSFLFTEQIQKKKFKKIIWQTHRLETEPLSGLSKNQSFSEKSRKEIPCLRVLSSQFPRGVGILLPILAWPLREAHTHLGSEHRIKIHADTLTLDERHILSQLPNSSQQSRTRPGVSERGRRVTRGSWGAAGGSPLRSGSPLRRPAAGLYLPVK